MRILETVRDMRAWSDRVRQSGMRIGLVPTMGYLHEGHMALVRRAQTLSDRCVVSIFVNPLQFGPTEDLDRYPRDLDGDRRMLSEAGVDVLFLPAVSEVYPRGFQTEVTVRQVTAGLCGRSRPGHFVGVTTVVAKLFNGVKPHLAVFGEKDFQQLVTVRRMVADLDFDLEIVGVPIVREADGLAMSSRNRYLTPAQRQAALALSRALTEARALLAAGERQAAALLERTRSVLAGEPSLRVDYVELVDTQALEPVAEVDRPSLLALAVKVGETRLIDNTVLARDGVDVSKRATEADEAGVACSDT